MSSHDKIKKLESEIQQIRLQIIQTITGINHLLARNPKAIKTLEYLGMKEKYQAQKEVIHFLATMRKSLAA